MSELEKKFEEVVKQFVEENECALTIVVVAPKGGWSYVQNYTPENWLIKIIPVKNYVPIKA